LLGMGRECARIRHAVRKFLERLEGKGNTAFRMGSTKGQSVLPWVFFITRIRTWRVSRPITAQTGGRSFSYVPRPRRLFALHRGGSCGSACHSPFFPGVLEHFVGFDFQIAQGFCRLFAFCIDLQKMPHFCSCCAADLQLARQFRRRFALEHLSNE